MRVSLHLVEVAVVAAAVAVQKPAGTSQVSSAFRTWPASAVDESPGSI